MRINIEGTRTGRTSSKSANTRSNRPKAQKLEVDAFGNALPVVLFAEPKNDAEPRVEMIGGHLGPRTKWEYPYSYDPILQFSNGQTSDGTCYSDRLMGWYGYDLVRKTMQKHFGEQGDYWQNRSPKAIEAFLQEILKLPNLKLTRIEEQCNVGNGFPVWFFAYQRGAEPVAES